MFNMKVLVFLAFGLLAVEGDTFKRCFLERNKSRKFLLGGFRPQCDSDGTYMVVQCHEAYCFCVHKKTGEEIPDTRVRGEPKCNSNNDCVSPKEAGDCRASFWKWNYNQTTDKCEKFVWGGCGGNENRYDTRKKCRIACGARKIKFGAPIVFQKGRTSEKLCLKKAAARSGPALLGEFVPRCNDDGLFQDIQCHEGSCFCVHRHTGETIPGTEVKSGRPKYCGKITKCRNQRAVALYEQYKLDKQEKKPNSDTLPALLPGVFIPQCDVIGNYKEVQCHDGGCFCVNATSGGELLGSRTRVAGEPTVCNTKCILARHHSYRTVKLFGLLGYILPRCTASGDYDKVQCIGGKCFCANTKTGKGIAGKYPEDCK